MPEATFNSQSNLPKKHGQTHVRATSELQWIAFILRFGAPFCDPKPMRIVQCLRFSRGWSWGHLILGLPGQRSGGGYRASGTRKQE